MELNEQMKSSLQIDRAATLNRHRAILALGLIVPVSSIAAAMSVWIAPGIIGQSVAVGCGIWMLLFPILWHIFIDRQQLKFNFFVWSIGSLDLGDIFHTPSCDFNRSEERRVGKEC